MKLLVILAAMMLLAGCSDKTIVSEGDRIGVITKLSKKLHCSSTWTWEGELAMAGGTNAARQNVGEEQAPTSVWKFSLGRSPNTGLAEKLQSIMNSGHPARVHYLQQLSPDMCEAESDYFAVDVADVGRQ